jgi:hypothetical protein
MFVALENLDDDDDVDISRALGKVWFDKLCSKLLNLRKHSKSQWMQNESQTDEENMKNIKCENSKTFSNKKGNVGRKIMSLK